MPGQRIKALCSLCHRATRLDDADLSYDAGARHAECHAAFMKPIEAAHKEGAHLAAKADG